ncbi:flagellar hook protein FlgE [Kineococcus indalonis]|uniref:flagellar hook protein FlgE n=1 Tax=Kineococcus indalonis TaxID=2696566 RepID=UPI001413187D|nr:flagellar hook protein FlgE [Kineococcus indalonis]NAZ86453.1 flagellar hook-basal body complex protein [Kineococcus indalonis]
MLRSMFSGVSGLRSHQTMMDVVGNNIANVNTTGYKSSSVVFADTLSQLTKTAGAPQDNTNNGGTNPSQVGLGVKVSTISQNFTAGSAQATGKATNLMLDGDGLFVVQKGDAQMYTRAGAFELDSRGSLVTADGSYVQGWRADESGQIVTTGPTETIIINSDNVMPAAPTTTATLVGNVDKTGKPVKLPGDDFYTVPVVTSSFDAYDAQGKPTRVMATFTNSFNEGSTATTAADVVPTDQWKLTLTYIDPATGQTVTPAVDAGTVNFDPATGKLPANGYSMDGDDIALTGLNDVTIKMDLRALTGYVSNTGNSTVKSTTDGAAIGTLNAFAVGADGVVMGEYSNGLKRPIGQVAVATFNNYAGLQKVGNSMFTVSANSGTPNIGVPGQNGRGAIGSGSLEMSNVDLSSEFTNLILAQRGFQANSRIISASDEILQDLVNLKR